MFQLKFKKVLFTFQNYILIFVIHQVIEDVGDVKKYMKCEV